MNTMRLEMPLRSIQKLSPILLELRSSQQIRMTFSLIQNYQMNLSADPIGILIV